ncbi:MULTISPECIES: hypothetical protein [unclassified Bradyrhizobium]
MPAIDCLDSFRGASIDAMPAKLDDLCRERDALAAPANADTSLSLRGTFQPGGSVRELTILLVVLHPSAHD